MTFNFLLDNDSSEYILCCVIMLCHLFSCHCYFINRSPTHNTIVYSFFYLNTRCVTLRDFEKIPKYYVIVQFKTSYRNKRYLNKTTTKNVSIVRMKIKLRFVCSLCFLCVFSQLLTYKLANYCNSLTFRMFFKYLFSFLIEFDL